MKIEIRIDPDYIEPRAIILTAAVTREVEAAVNALRQSGPGLLAGLRDGRVELLEPDSLLRIWAEGGRVYAAAGQGVYTLRQRLYEVEQTLDPTRFVRISHGEIINLRRVEHFDLNLAGSICVRLADGTVTWVSRRYVPRIRAMLKL